MSISVALPGSFGSKLAPNTAELPKVDDEFEKITEGQELTKVSVKPSTREGELDFGGALVRS